MVKKYELIQGNDYTIGFTKGKDLGFEITYDKNNRNIIKDVNFLVNIPVKLHDSLKTKAKVVDASVNEFNDFAKRAIKFIIFKSGIDYTLISNELKSKFKILEEETI